MNISQIKTSANSSAHQPFLGCLSTLASPADRIVQSVKKLPRNVPVAKQNIELLYLTLKSV
jgi:hypothetical protein